MQLSPQAKAACLRSSLVFGTAAITGILLAWSGTDLALTRHYFRESWATGRESWATILYTYGPWVAATLAIGGLVAGLWSLKTERGGRAAWFFPLLMLLGPGLLVNLAGKEGMGRPRPRSVIEFGGKDEYRVAGWPGPPGDGRKSFPSGHASMGFYLMAGYFVWRGRRPALARASLAAGLVMGAAIGWARIAQGGHFLSDIIWAGAVVFLAGELLSALLLRGRTSDDFTVGDKSAEPSHSKP
ncbi:MAG: phosphatase PAP2 family protein [Opitutaceae bacterium]|jgi:membrane-associated PAP2 superfamily phosphatase